MRLITILLFIFFNLTSIGQTDKIQFSSPNKWGGVILKMCGIHNAMTYSVQRDKKMNYYIVESNNSLEKHKKIKIPLSENKQSLNYEDVIQIEDKIHILVSFANKKHSKLFLFDKVYDLTTREFKNDLDPITSISFDNINHPGYFIAKYSRDKSKIAICGYFSRQSNSGILSTAVIYDGTFNKLSTFESLPFNNNTVNTESTLISDDGTLYYLSRINESYRPIRQYYGQVGPWYKSIHNFKSSNQGKYYCPEPDYNSSYELHMINENSKSESYRIAFESEDYISDISMCVGAGKVFIGSLISNNPNRAANRYKSIILNDDLTQPVKATHEFTAEIKLACAAFSDIYGRSKVIQKSSEIIPNAYIRSIEFLNNRFVSLFEQYQYITSTVNTGNGMTTSSTIQIYGNIVTMSVDNNSNMIDQQFIPKSERGSSNGYLHGSFKPILYNDKLYVLYNSLGRDLIKSHPDLTNINNKANALVLLQISEDSNSFSDSILKIGKLKETSAIIRSIEIIDDTVILVTGGFFGKKQKIAKLQL